ncbi:wac protein [Fusarium langsethiae]|uniref:Wac protein n=1 Tax=Fusarium langsethiae TaxID=179993 RepID=A0A0M9EMF2_FUSLA|nr:wac protein [Fusarium langsethiae]
MPHYLLHDEYTSDQQQLKTWIQDEFHQAERSIDTVRDDIKSLDNRVETVFASVRNEIKSHDNRVQTQFKSVGYEFGRMHQRFEQVDQRFDRVEADIQQIKVDIQRFSAQAQNSRIRNPHVRINPIITFDPVSGRIRTPDPTLFPKSATEFYSLREPTTTRKQVMLDYLVDFYDITHIDVPEDEPHDDASTRPELAVGYLESILGLDENNIIQFRERARALDQRGWQPSKRVLESQASSPQAQKQKLDIRTAPHQDTTAWQDKSSSGLSTKLGWDNNPTPESKKEMNRQIREYQEKQRTKKLDRAMEECRQQRRAQGRSSFDRQDSSGSDNPLEKGAEKDVSERSGNSGSKTNPNTPRKNST